MITKSSEVCVPCLYMWIKEKSVNIKTKKREGAYIIVSKRTLHFEYVSIE